MAGKSKFYVVWAGVKPGIYDSWTACEQQIKGYPDAKYKSYNNRFEAEAAWSDGWSPTAKKPAQSSLGKFSSIITPSICVDGACSGNPGASEYRGVWTANGEEIFHQGPFPGGSNNLAEFLALVHGLAWLSKRNDQSTAVYSDSRTALAWLKAKRIKSTIPRSGANRVIFDLLDRAESWINKTPFKNPVLKWETDWWGENPADFGRK